MNTFFDLVDSDFSDSFTLEHMIDSDLRDIESGQSELMINLETDNDSLIDSLLFEPFESRGSSSNSISSSLPLPLLSFESLNSPDFDLFPAPLPEVNFGNQTSLIRSLDLGNKSSWDPVSFLANQNNIDPCSGTTSTEGKVTPAQVITVPTAVDFANIARHVSSTAFGTQSVASEEHNPRVFESSALFGLNNDVIQNLSSPSMSSDGASGMSKLSNCSWDPVSVLENPCIISTDMEVQQGQICAVPAASEFNGFTNTATTQASSTAFETHSVATEDHNPIVWESSALFGLNNDRSEDVVENLPSPFMSSDGTLSMSHCSWDPFSVLANQNNIDPCRTSTVVEVTQPQVFAVPAELELDDLANTIPQTVTAFEPLSFITEVRSPRVLDWDPVSLLTIKNNIDRCIATSTEGKVTQAQVITVPASSALVDFVNIARHVSSTAFGTQSVASEENNPRVSESSALFALNNGRSDYVGQNLSSTSMSSDCTFDMSNCSWDQVSVLANQNSSNPCRISTDMEVKHPHGYAVSASSELGDFANTTTPQAVTASEPLSLITEKHNPRVFDWDPVSVLANQSNIDPCGSTTSTEGKATQAQDFTDAASSALGDFSDITSTTAFGSLFRASEENSPRVLESSALFGLNYDRSEDVVHNLSSPSKASDGIFGMSNCSWDPVSVLKNQNTVKQPQVFAEPAASVLGDFANTTPQAIASTAASEPLSLITKVHTPRVLDSSAPFTLNNDRNETIAQKVVQNLSSPSMSSGFMDQTSVSSDDLYTDAASKSPDAACNPYPKPPFSYSCLAAIALRNSNNESLFVPEIYQFICYHFPYFKMSSSSWKKSLRHSLSECQSFEKVKLPIVEPYDKQRCKWVLNKKKEARINVEIAKLIRRDIDGITRAMGRPENLDKLLNGELKYAKEVNQESITVPPPNDEIIWHVDIKEVQ